jgi:hypothetical protein
MESQTPRERAIEEIAKRLADPTASAASIRELNQLLEGLAQESDFESLSEISQRIREQFEAGAGGEGEGKKPAAGISALADGKSLIKTWTEHTAARKVVLGGGLAVVVILLGFVLFNVVASLGGARRSSALPGSEGSLPAVGQVVTSTQAVQLTVTATEVATPQPSPTPSPSPTPAPQEYAVNACVRWQADQEVGLAGASIAWQIEGDESGAGETAITGQDGCASFPVLALPDSRITLLAQPPQDAGNLEIAGQATSPGGQGGSWEAVEEQGVSGLVTTLGEEPPAEIDAQFLVVARRTFSGQVLAEDGSGLAAAQVQLWSRSGPGEEWSSTDQKATTDAQGSFVLTDTTGLPQVFYRIGLSQTISSRYVYTTTSASGPGDVWAAGRDAQLPSMALLETKSGLGPDQLSVADLTFNQKLAYVMLDIQDAVLEPDGTRWETLSAPAGAGEIVSKVATINQANVDRLQARWENVELPPGIYALEIWTPENANARVAYSVSDASGLLDERVSYQSTRQERGQVNQWIDFSITLNPSLVFRVAGPGRVSVTAKPSLTPTNREYNLTGNIRFGAGPVRLVKQG